MTVGFFSVFWLANPVMEGLHNEYVELPVQMSKIFNVRGPAMLILFVAGIDRLTAFETLIAGFSIIWDTDE